MHPFDMARLLQLRRQLIVVHHIRGRIRLRLGPALFGQIPELSRQGLQDFLASLKGIGDLRLNPAAKSVVIEYDPERFPPELWDTLVEGDDTDVERLLSMLVRPYK
jgi:hypothetical protein